MSKDLVQQQFGQNAENYVHSPVHAKGKSLARLVELVAPQSSWHCLDVASATGHTAFAFAPHVAHVISSDLTKEMLDQARSQAAERGIANVSFAQADAEELPFGAGEFDLVTCRIAPHHFPDPGKFVAEVTRVLKPGGTFALVDNLSPDGHTNPELSAKDAEVAAQCYNAYEKLRDPSHGRALTEAEWRSLALAAGLQVATIEHLSKDMLFSRWCKTMSVEEPTVGQLRQMIADAPASLSAFLRPRAVNSEAQKGVDGEIGNDFTFTLTEIVLVATKPLSGA